MLAGDLFDPLKKVMPFLEVNPQELVTRNCVHFLSKWSSIVCLIAQIFISSHTTIIDDPLQCFTDLSPKHGVPHEFAADYCWLHGTYVVEEYMTGAIGKQIALPGIGPEQDKSNHTATFTRVYNRQYILYPIIILIQHFMFWVSWTLWRHLEGGRLGNLISEMTIAIKDQAELKNRLSTIAVYITSHLSFNNVYAYKFIFCELYSVFSVVLQFLLIDFFLHGKFMGFGVQGIRYIRAVSNGQRGLVNPFWVAFPKVTKCEIEIGGPSGNMQLYEALCIMPINNMAEKIFFFMWFWLIAVGILHMVGLVYRILVLTSRKLRYAVIRIKLNKSTVDLTNVKFVVENFSYGDWFVMSLMQKNMDSWIFSQLVDELKEKIRDADRKKQ